MKNKAMPRKVLLLAALEEEFGPELGAMLGGRCDVKFTGVGKLRAFETTLKALENGDYDVVVNAGTCGSMKHPAGTLLHPSSVLQGDIYLDSIFATAPEELNTGERGVSIVSGDNFISPESPAAHRAELARYDCFDMESYAIARAVQFHAAQGRPQPSLYMIKLVSDNADGSMEEWGVRIERLRPALLAAVKKLVEEIQ